MSYLVYINGKQIEVGASVSFARTLQVNDIANITTRNSNYTQSIKIPRTAKNIRIMESVFNVGNTSNVPYQKATCDVIDADTGQHVIYKGWFVLLETTAKDYSGTIYDGVLDFYRSFENITLTQVGVSELNHEKNLTNVIGSWNNDLPYRYILADYNGKNLTDLGITNIDFQVPSASVPYLWDKIFEYIGWTYEGEIFNHEKFQNLWVSYPKPVSEETPVQELVTEQTSQIVTNQVLYPNGGGTFFGSASFVSFFPDALGFDPLYYNFTTGAVQQGLFRLSFEPAVFSLDTNGAIITSSRLRFYVIDSLNQFASTNFLNIANGNYIDLNLNIGDRVLIQVVYENVDFPFNGQSTPTQTSILTGEASVTMNFISGFNLGFDEAFIDFKVSDFIREIVVRFGLTIFKDKYSNKVKFLTLYELLQDTVTENWTNKFVNKMSEKYTFGNYAKKNTFAYKYNDAELKHNNGALTIDDANLKEEVTILNSLIFSPERIQNSFLGGCNTYKIWEKQIKDDETVEYKDLDGRFYFLRADKVDTTITVASEILGGDTTNPIYYRESYWRLPFSEILFDWYAPITAIFNKAKLIQAEINLKPIDIYNFDFSKLVYIGQLSSYYLVNKINNYVKGKPIKVELIEVDYFTETQVVQPENPDYIVEVGEPTVDSCEVTLPVNTDYEQPTEVIVNVYAGGLDVLSNVTYTQLILSEPITAMLSGNEVSFGIESLPYNLLGYKFSISIITDNAFITYTSNLSDNIILDGSCFIEPDYPDTLVIDNIVDLGQDPTAFLPNTKIYRIEYSHTGIPSGTNYILKVEGFGGFAGGWFDVGNFSKTEGSPTDLTQQVTAFTVTKFRITIQDATSIEYVL
jgi:hypothetical protein